MAIDDSVFADYAAAQGDFGGAFAPPPQQQGMGGVAQVAPMAQPGAMPVTQAQAAPNPIEEVSNHPFFQFFNQWKGSSKEKQKTAIARLSQDFPNPGAMGLPVDQAVIGEPKIDKDTNKPVPDPSSWDKFIKFADSNPQFLLELGAKLLAPRQAGASQAGHIAAGLSTSFANLQQRKAAAAAAQLKGAKTQAETQNIQAETGKVPSEIEKNFSIAYKNYADAEAGSKTKAAAAVQLLDTMTDSLWATGKGVKFKTRDEAKIAAQRMISGHGSPEEVAYYDYLKENAIFGATPESAQEMLSGAPSESNIRAQEEQKVQAEKARTQQQITFMESLGYDPERVADALAKRPQFAQLPREQQIALANQSIAKVRALSKVQGKTPKASTPIPAAKPKPKPAAKPAAAKPKKDLGKAYLEGYKKRAEEKKQQEKEEVARTKEIRQLTGKSRKAILAYKKENFDKMTVKQKFQLSRILRAADK